MPLTGPAAPGYDEIAPAMKAVFTWVNAHGGVYGRKIHYTYLDDGYNPANTATLTRKLVLQDNIFADVGSLGTPTQAAVQGFLNSQKVPQLFIESGCNCWSDPAYPESSRLAAPVHRRGQDPRQLRQGQLRRKEDRVPLPGRRVRPGPREGTGYGDPFGIGGLASDL